MILLLRVISNYNVASPSKLILVLRTLSWFYVVNEQFFVVIFVLVVGIVGAFILCESHNKKYFKLSLGSPSTLHLAKLYAREWVENIGNYVPSRSRRLKEKNLFEKISILVNTKRPIGRIFYYSIEEIYKRRRIKWICEQCISI